MNFPLVQRRLLEEQASELQALNLEYQNFRRRNSEARNSAYENGRRDTVLAFLPVYDNLLRAMKHPCEDEAYVTGIRMTLRSLSDVLSSMGITEIPALGETFDPAVHEALEHITDPDAGENIITEVALTGFRQGNTVLRHALVIVAN